MIIAWQELTIQLEQNILWDSTSFGIIIKLLYWHIRSVPFTGVAAWVQLTHAEYLSFTVRQIHVMLRSIEQHGRLPGVQPCIDSFL